MKFKEYEMPDGKKAVFEYDESGVGKITLECMDMLMGFINDRKTESNSEKLNNCETCEHYKLTCDLFSEICKYEPKDELTISKMEQVDKDIYVRSKTEPQTCSVSGRPYSECADCEHFRCTADEPQYRSE